MGLLVVVWALSLAAALRGYSPAWTVVIVGLLFVVPFRVFGEKKPRTHCKTGQAVIEYRGKKKHGSDQLEWNNGIGKRDERAAVSGL